MPGFDRTGPYGAGPRTGWGMGRCGGYAGEGGRFARGSLRGVGRGGAPWGGGRGRCFGGRGMGWYGGVPAAGWAPPSPTEEADALRAELSAAEGEIAAMKARLEELERKE
ncbi:MAG: DUF5320 domain-containing protein [Desulfomonilaceae bacterium]|nr:DUF5320 domain-containing protein [Desulfomonilaceae bacterium]